MSKSSSPSFLTQVLFCQNKSVFLECMIISNSSEVKSKYNFANDITSSKSFSFVEIDEQKLSISNTTKEHWSFRLILRYHFMTEDVFFHWFILFSSNMVLLTLSNICLLIFPISVLDGFIRRQDILSGNPSLWSLIERALHFHLTFVHDHQFLTY